ncbi:MAG: type 2 lanthipeptide synthetase LanM family protein [Cyanobacteria bacterium P01_A01_bin.83]
MQVLPEYLIKIVERSSTISERLHNKVLFNSTPNNDNLINSRINNWSQTVAEGNQEKFAKRLAWDGLDANIIRRVLGSVRLANEQNLPAWTETFKAALEAAELEPSAALENKFLNSEQPLPFEELFLSFIYVARQKVKAKTGSSYLLLSSEAHANLERYLLKSLTSLGSRAIGIDFQIFRAYEQPTLNRWLGQFQGSHSRKQYDKFINKMLSGELLSFFQEYSVLARLTATVTDFWINNTCEFIQRLASDWSDIQTTFQESGELGKVIAIQTGLSDLHHNGRSVIAVSFTSGLKLIYKPKDLSLDEAFFQLLDWLNRKGIPQPLKLLQLLNRSHYGWVEYVEHLPCPDKQAAMRYYQRSGMILCLLYALSGGDFHRENIIACGEQPVLIDLEMLMSAVPREEESLDGKTNALDLAFEQFTYSVLSTSFLPKWELGRDGLVYDASGLGGSGGQQTHFCKSVWQNINTDGMVLHQEYVKTMPKSNLPMLNDIRLSPNDYVEELVDGFCQMYQFLIAHRETLLAVNSPLAKLAHQRIRSIFRPSQVYASLIEQTLQPKYLRDGVDFSIALDILSKSLLKFASKPNTWQIVAAETQALAHLDIPLFTAYPNQDDLKLNPHQSVKRYFVEPSYDLVINRLSQLDRHDLERQISFIRSSLYTRIASEVEQPRSLFGYTPLHFETIYKLTKKSLIQQALELARELQQRAVRATDGSVTWMGMDYLPSAGRLQQKPMSYDFYDGSSGVALFLSALAKVTESKEFRDLALGALQPIRNLLQNLNSIREQTIIKQIGIGGGKGIGSIIYTLVQSSHFLAEPLLLQDARQLALQIDPIAIAADKKFDIVSGTAGTILGLLALYDTTEDSTVLELAKSCGYHLLNHRVASDTGYRAWATVNGKLLTGFSHGAAGIAYALLRLYAVASDPTFLQGAEEAIAYEGSVFDSPAQNWPDLRAEKLRFSMSWCNGAPGIGLARLGSLAILDTPEIRQNIEVALQTTHKFSFPDIDHLCCGNFGRIEMLLVAAEKLERTELLNIAQQRAAYVLDQAKKIGSFQIFPKHCPGLYNPGFFQGTAGIGYELLRLADREQFPSVLLWE